MTILFRELAGSPVETYEPDGLKAERRLLCAYEDRHAVVVELLGNGNWSGGRLQAPYPGCPGCMAMRVRIEPFEKRPDNQGTFADLTADLNSYSGQFVEVVVTYDLLDADGRHPKLRQAEAGTILTYRMNFGGEYLSIPGQALHWESDPNAPVPPGAVPALRIPVVEHHVTWHRVLNPPWDAMRNCVGAVNAAPLLGAAAETVLFDGAKANRQFAGLNDLQQPQFGWRITYVFREKAIKVLGVDGGGQIFGWNHCWRDLPFPAACWDRLLDPNGNTLYRTANLGTLFLFAAT